MQGSGIAAPLHTTASFYNKSRSRTLAAAFVYFLSCYKLLLQKK